MRHSIAVMLSVAIGSASLASAAAPSTSPEPRVTLRVKDAEARDAIRVLQKQCGVRNVVVDRDVAGRATFHLTGAPCSQAWSVVLKTYGLAATSYSDAVIHVETRR